MATNRKTKKSLNARATIESVVRSVVHEVLDELGLVKQIQALDTMAADAAKRAVIETLTMLGIDAANPLKTQATSVALAELIQFFADPEVQRDLSHLRTWRRRMDQIDSKGTVVVITSLILGTLAALWVGFKNQITNR